MFYDACHDGSLLPNRPFYAQISHSFPVKTHVKNGGNRQRMKVEETLVMLKNAEKNHDLSGILRTLDAECRNCAPLNPLECITRCNVWKLKNELRRLRETMDNPNFLKNLFNVLKNNTRLHILKAIVKSRYSVSKLQEELKKAGYSHSQETITEEYLRPLLDVGLAAEAQDQYYATTFGGRLTELLGDFPEYVDILPAHSECYEETLLNALLSGPKTFEDVERSSRRKLPRGFCND